MFFFLYYDITGIKCIVKCLYSDRKGSFTNLTNLGLKWAVCGPPSKMRDPQRDNNLMYQSH